MCARSSASPEMEIRTKILIIGHTFISRLERLLDQSELFPADFNLAQCEIWWFGISWGRAESLLRDQDLHNCIHSFKPAVFILQIGRNDICNASARPEKVACNISELMETLGKFECVQVGVVCELFIRIRPRNISSQMYSERRKIINNMLPVLLGDINNKKILFWRHLRLMNSALHVLGSDEIHLSAVGHKKFYRSIRLAIVHA